MFVLAIAVAMNFQQSMSRGKHLLETPGASSWRQSPEPADDQVLSVEADGSAEALLEAAQRADSKAGLEAQLRAAKQRQREAHAEAAALGRKLRLLEQQQAAEELSLEALTRDDAAAIEAQLGGGSLQELDAAARFDNVPGKDGDDQVFMFFLRSDVGAGLDGDLHGMAKWCTLPMSQKQHYEAAASHAYELPELDSGEPVTQLVPWTEIGSGGADEFFQRPTQGPPGNVGAVKPAAELFKKTHVDLLTASGMNARTASAAACTGAFCKFQVARGAAGLLNDEIVPATECVKHGEIDGLVPDATCTCYHPSDAHAQTASVDKDGNPLAEGFIHCLAIDESLWK